MWGHHVYGLNSKEDIIFIVLLESIRNSAQSCTWHIKIPTLCNNLKFLDTLQPENKKCRKMGHTPVASAQ
jgi:hypothetical protein